jgi:hypothetical protein
VRRIAPLVVIVLSCIARGPHPDAALRIREALADLEAGGFEFDPDVAFRVDPYAVCEGIACADVVLIRERRTILLAPDALRSPSMLRATLLEIWERYSEPRPGSIRDLARGAQRVARDGPQVGVDDPRLLQRARLTYRQLYDTLPPDERDGLSDPLSHPDGEGVR